MPVNLRITWHVEGSTPPLLPLQVIELAAAVHQLNQDKCQLENQMEMEEVPELLKLFAVQCYSSADRLPAVCHTHVALTYCRYDGPCAFAVQEKVVNRLQRQLEGLLTNYHILEQACCMFPDMFTDNDVS